MLTVHSCAQVCLSVCRHCVTVLSVCLNCMTCMAAHAFQVIVFAPHIYTTACEVTHVSETHNWFTNTRCEYTHVLPAVQTLTRLHFGISHSHFFCFKVYIRFSFLDCFWVFYRISILCCLFFPSPPLVLFLFPSSGPLPARSLSLKLQSHLWTVAVHCLRDVPARCAPTAHLVAVQCQWWKWHQSPSYLGHASLSTLGSSTCFLSERQHHYGRYEQHDHRKSQYIIMPGSSWNVFLILFRKVVLVASSIHS